MFASFSVFPTSSLRLRRARTILRCTALGLITMIDAVQATAAPVCQPQLAFRQVSFSPINYETMQRRWRATLSVDASGCASASGRFEILFGLWSETALDDEFVRAFVWTPGVMEVAVDVAAHEAIAGHQLQNVAFCPCRETQEGASE